MTRRGNLVDISPKCDAASRTLPKLVTIPRRPSPADCVPYTVLPIKSLFAHAPVKGPAGVVKQPSHRTLSSPRTGGTSVGTLGRGIPAFTVLLYSVMMKRAELGPD